MKPFTTISVLVLSLMALVQLARFLLGWEVVINGWAVPLWVSAIAFVAVAALAWMLWRESHRQGSTRADASPR